MYQLQRMSKYQKEICVIILLLIIGVTLYFPILTQRLANPDAVWNGVIVKEPDGWEISLGRFGIWIYDTIRDYHISPFLVTLVSLMWNGIIAVLIGRIFEMTECSTLITGVLLLTAPHLMDLLTYYYCSSVYMLSFFCAVLSAYMFIGSESKKGWSFLLGCLGIFISLSIYQAYLFVAVTLCLLKTINVLLRQWKDRTIKESCIRLFSAAVGCVCSSVIYIIVAKAIQKLTGHLPDTARGVDTMGSIPLERIGNLIKGTYVYFYRYFFTDRLLKNSAWKLQWINLGIFILLLVICFAWIILPRVYQQMRRLGLIILGILCIPIVFTGITIAAWQFSLEGATGILVVPTMQIVYIWGVSLVDKGSDSYSFTRCLKRSYFLFIGALLIIQICFLGTFQRQMQYQQERYLNAAEQMQKEIMKIAGGDPEVPVMVLGTLDGHGSHFVNERKETDQSLQWTVASYGMVWDNWTASLIGWYHIFRDYLDLGYERCWDHEYNEFRQTGQYEKMPTFPEEGSVILWQDKVIIKVSVWPEE